MRATRLLSWMIILTCSVAVVTAQPADPYQQDPYRDPPGEPQPVPSAGFWPTERMQFLIIDRMTEEMSKVYDFDEEQLYLTREIWKEKFPLWLQENRGQIMQATNEYFEALLAGEAPSPEYVADWAQRTLPLVNQFADLVEDTGVEMRTYMTEEQQVMLDGHMAAFRVGMSYTTQRLGAWSEGAFDPETEWIGNPEARRIQEEREREIQREAREAELIARGLSPEEAAAEAGTARGQQAPPRASTTQPADEWARYVEQFIQRYQLVDSQRSRAMRYLRDMQERRDRYERRKQRDFERARELLDSDSPRDRAVAGEILEEREKTLERMFTQLKERLNKLPTREQRLEAAQRGDQDDAATAARDE